MSLWFAGTAVAPLLQARWSLDAAQVGWLTAIVQLGFVTGTALAAILNLADLVPSRYYVAVCATLGALANALVLIGNGFPMALTSRFFTGFFLAGVYPPAMKMAATWFRSRRGLAIGIIVGALTIGKALPFLVKAFAWRDVAPVILAASLFAVVGAAIVVLTYRDGPYPFASRPFSWGLVGTVVRTPRWRLATGGYLGHMFELYSFWTWIPAFLAASAAARRPTGEHTIALTTFLVIAFGALGVCLGRRGSGQTRSRAGHHHRARGEWELCATRRGILRRGSAAHRGDGLGLEFLRHCGQRSVQRARHRVGTGACGGDSADHADMSRISPHADLHSARSAHRAARGVGCGIWNARPGAGRWHHRHPRPGAAP